MQIPVFEQLVEDLGWFQARAQLVRDRLDDRFVHLGEPAGRGDRPRDRTALLAFEPGTELVDVGQQPSRLVLLDVEAGSRPEVAGVMALLDQRRLHRERAPVAIDRQLLDVESELVDAPYPLLDPPAVVEVDRVDPRQLVPQLLVPHPQALGDCDRVDLVGDPPARDQFVQAAGHVLDGDVDVVGPHPVTDRRVTFGRLGIDQIGHHRAGITTPQDVRQRAVAPVDAFEVQAHQQHDPRIHQPVGERICPLARAGTSTATRSRGTW
jgi:hypothetical protein